jgi:hypothetical protein
MEIRGGSRRLLEACGLSRRRVVELEGLHLHPAFAQLRG